MAELKTKPTDASVAAYIAAMPDARLRGDLETLLRLLSRVTKAEPRMWGEGMVGFGTYHYTYASGREGDWFVTGFAARKTNLTIYLMCGFEPLEAHLSKLGKHKIGKGCLYVKSLADIDLKVLEAMLRTCVKFVAKHQGCGSQKETK